MNNNAETLEQQILLALQAVKDPEIPTISVVDLGIITKVACNNGNALVTMTPTFTACPAIKIMQQQIKETLDQLPFVTQSEVVVDYSIPWTSNRITERGRKQIEEHGLASPAKYEGEVDLAMIEQAHCPHCGSTHTSLNVLFGATLCRSIHFCYDCKQSFEAFKPV